MFSNERLNRTAATAVGIVAGLVGYGLLWFTNLANGIPHGWGYIWLVIFIVAACAGYIAALATDFAVEGVALLIGGILGAVMTGFAIERPIDDKLWAWTIGSPWGYIVTVVIMPLFAVIGVVLYRAICKDEYPDTSEQWYFAGVIVAFMLVCSGVLGMIFGLLGFQIVLPTTGW